jgi:hypothetical protein
MTELSFPSRPWGSSIAGTVLILLACTQLVYSTLAIASAFGASLFELSVMGVQAVSAMGPDGATREVTGTERGPALINAAFEIGIIGYGLSCAAIIGGILVLLRRQGAVYVIAVFVILCLHMAYRHMMISWYGCSTTYLVVGAVFSSLLVANCVAKRESNA